jgi:beta-galactosidase
MKKVIGYFIGVLVTFQSLAQSTKIYGIDANVPDKKIYSRHLRLGGTNRNGKKIAVNNFYLTIGGKPVIPITGEFHFSRYPQQYWDESIKKMKAGGVTVIATYVFWNLHEEEEGKFEWTGDKNVRAFVELCKKNEVYAIVRIGPFCHGEIRNGGYPDWLLGKPLNIRSNDPLYLSYVNRLYGEIGQQLNGLYYKDGGPVIGIQIENEYQHSAAPWGLTYPGQPLDLTAAESDLKEIQEGVGTAKGDNPFISLGNDHMKVLKSLSMKAGMDVPIYTATGWGYAATIPNESLPVTAAYAYPFWTPARDYSPFFLYKDMHANPDYSPVRYRPEDYPAFPAELGSGIMTVYSRRPIAVHQSLDALINRCLGSGANGIGYYMYHGGSTPKGKHSFMSDEAYGLPKISYDFQAPVGEFGQVREGFHRLKLLHFFIHDFGDLLAPMQTVLPANSGSLVPEDISQLRYAVRVKGNSGFLFLNNFQDDTTMKDQKNIRLKIKTGQGDVSIPEAGSFDLKSGENAIFPFNLALNGVQLRYATAQLLMKASDPNPYYVFFTPEGIHGEFSFAAGTKAQNVSGATIDVNSKRTLVKCTAEVNEFSVTAGGKKTTILVIDKSRALKAYVVTINGHRSLIFSDAVVLPASTGFELLSDAQNSFGLDVYPKLTVLPKTAIGNISKITGNKTFSSWCVQLSPVDFPINKKQITSRKIAVDLPQSLPAGVNDVYLAIDYTGDTGMGFLNGELVADEFYHGIPWTIGLRKFISPVPGAKEMVLYFRPMQKNASYIADLQPYPQYIPDFERSNSYLKVNSISFVPQYKTLITF